MDNSEDRSLRERLLHAMRGDESHIDFDSAVGDFPLKLRGAKPSGVPHSAWQLLEHMRIAQHDILEFSRNPEHQSPKWPDEYWPKEDAPASDGAWQESVKQFKEEAQALEELIQSSADLFQPIEGGSGQTLLREALVVGSHNSYHLGQLMLLKKMLEA